MSYHVIARSRSILQVRSRAQVKLFTALDQFSYSYTVLIPHLLKNLQQDSSQFHEQFKVGLMSHSDLWHM
jgi:hypothetical protein